MQRKSLPEFWRDRPLVSSFDSLPLSLKQLKIIFISLVAFIEMHLSSALSFFLLYAACWGMEGAQLYTWRTLCPDSTCCKITSLLSYCDLTLFIYPNIMFIYPNTIAYVNFWKFCMLIFYGNKYYNSESLLFHSLRDLIPCLTLD